jgi:TRAP-type C4-dicarboxylate transport system substrate-binding protein
MKEVAKGYVVHPNIAPTPANMLINKRSYDALPKDIQEILQNEGPIIGFAAYPVWLNQCLWAIENAEREYGVKIYRWSPEDTAKVYQVVADKVWPKIAAKSPESAELMEILKKQMKDYGRIK